MDNKGGFNGIKTFIRGNERKSLEGSKTLGFHVSCEKVGDAGIQKFP